MNKETIRQGTEAHGWVGLCISVPLFIIFWTGAVTLFYPEVSRWASMPQLSISPKQDPPPLNTLIESKIKDYAFDDSRQLSVRLPQEHSPYMRLFVPVFESEQEEKDLAEYKQKVREAVTSGTGSAEEIQAPTPGTKRLALLIDPHTGETLADDNPFHLADFINQVHFTLKLPQGLYIVGVVTFFFFVIVLTGIVIQLKHMIEHFFLYRHDTTNSYKMKDLHNVVGVISLPYGLMYALTGLMFNLHILFEISTMMFLYQGDTVAMMKDVGFANHTEKPAYVAQVLPDLNALVAEVESTHNASVQGLNIQNYGDENSIVRISGLKNGTFAQRIDQHYVIKEQKFSEVTNLGDDSLFRDGVFLLFSIHMASFAGVDLRVVYFLLAVGVCVMIVAGNVLWIVKRQKKAEYPKTLAATRGFTLGGCMGVIVATSFAFLLERLLPVAMEHRADILMWSFGAVLLISGIAAFYNQDMKKFISTSCFAGAAVLALLVGVDIVGFGSEIVSLWDNGFAQPASVTISLALTSALLAWLGARTLEKEETESSAQPDAVTA